MGVSAVLTFNGETVDDSDCEEPPLPPTPALGLTGSTPPVGPALAALLLALAGLLILVARRRTV